MLCLRAKVSLNSAGVQVTSIVSPFENMKASPSISSCKNPKEHRPKRLGYASRNSADGTEVDLVVGVLVDIGVGYSNANVVAFYPFGYFEGNGLNLFPFEISIDEGQARGVVGTQLDTLLINYFDSRTAYMYANLFCESEKNFFSLLFYSSTFVLNLSTFRGNLLNILPTSDSMEVS